MASSLGQFLNEGDLDEARRLAKRIECKKLEECEKDMVTNLLEYNWNEEPQMVSNLLHFPLMISPEMRLRYLLKGLKEEKIQYYVVAASCGVSELALAESEVDQFMDILKEISTSRHGMIAVRAFMSLSELLKHPQDTPFVLKFMYKANSMLRFHSLDWLIANVKNTAELLALLDDKQIPEEVRQEVLDKVNNASFDKEGDQDWSAGELNLLTFIPNLADFEAMMTKEQTLSELFTELDTDKDGLIGVTELQTFCEDIGQDLTREKAQKDIYLVDRDNDGKINKDEWIELMFPRFNIE